MAGSIGGQISTIDTDQQQLQISGNNLSITNGNTVALPVSSVLPATLAPVADNESDANIRTGLVGTSTKYAREDHNHPIRRQGNPGTPTITGGGSGGSIQQTILLDTWSTEESYSYRFRVLVNMTAGTSWYYIQLPGIGGFQQPKIGAIGTYRSTSNTPQNDSPTGAGSNGAAPYGPFMGCEAHHWSSTNRIYQGYNRRETNYQIYIEFTVDYFRI